MEQAFGVPGHGFHEASLSIAISGTIENISRKGDWARYLLITDAPENAAIRLNWKNKEAFKKGEHVYAVCELSTPRKETPGGMKTYEDLIVYDMVSARGPRADAVDRGDMATVNE